MLSRSPFFNIQGAFSNPPLVEQFRRRERQARRVVLNDRQATARNGSVGILGAVGMEGDELKSVDTGPPESSDHNHPE
jgi:hypothetical protein